MNFLLAWEITRKGQLCFSCGKMHLCKYLGKLLASVEVHQGSKIFSLPNLWKFKHVKSSSPYIDVLFFFSVYLKRRKGVWKREVLIQWFTPLVSGNIRSWLGVYSERLEHFSASLRREARILLSHNSFTLTRSWINKLEQAMSGF